MTNQTALLKHYKKYPGKVLPSINHQLALQHLSPTRITLYEAKSLQELLPDPDASMEQAEQSRTCWLKIATSDVDRAGDTLQLEGLDTTNFLKNPQLLWMHGLTGLPIHTIGRILKIVQQDDALYALAEYVSSDVYAFADQIYQLDAAGFLPANSIGFHPIEWEKNDNGGFDFTKWELIECSKVELPMNPYAIDDEGPAAITSRYYSQSDALRWFDYK